MSSPAAGPVPCRRRHLAAGAARLPLLLVLLAGACSSGGGPASSAGTTTTTAVATTTTRAAATTTTRGPATTAAPGTVIRVRVAGGQVETDQRRVRIGRGERVRLEVVADVTDEVHVHGYDLRRDVAPGGTAVIAFTADRPGVYEVELEAARRRLLQLEVR